MATEFRMASKGFNKFLKVILGSYMSYLFRYRIKNDNIAGLKPPYIILANHTNFWDPFLLSMCFPDPVYFVTSDIHFRNPVLRWLLKLVGAIAKTKNVSDPKTIKDIIRVVRHDGIIGIFPEGRRSWDGKVLPLLYPTAKLIKSLNLPVVTVMLKGAYLSMPRWAKKTRKGALHMICDKILDIEDIAALSADEIYARITGAMNYDEYEYQKEKMVRYKTGRPAEKLELFLFCCPMCKSVGTLKSEKRNFSCLSCGYSVEYNEYGFFSNTTGRLYYDNPRDWNQWQLGQLGEMIGNNKANSSKDPVFEDNDVILQSGTGERHKSLRKDQIGKLSLFHDSILFKGPQGPALTFLFNKITGENVQLNCLLEFYHEKTLYKFSGNSEKLSAYKWVKAIEIYKNSKQQQNSKEILEENL